jgi:Ala-tRNA(Pro) deacylase
MPISPTVQTYLENAHINYDLVRHGFSQSTYDAACSAHVPIANVIKSVVLHDKKHDNYVIAMIPASNKLKLNWVNQTLGRDLSLAHEYELQDLMPDCMLGAIPATGQAYGFDVVWDSELKEQRELYFEGGDHEQLIHITPSEFQRLFGDEPEAIISIAAENYSMYHADELRSSML